MANTASKYFLSLAYAEEAAQQALLSEMPIPQEDVVEETPIAKESEQEEAKKPTIDQNNILFNLYKTSGIKI